MSSDAKPQITAEITLLPEGKIRIKILVPPTVHEGKLAEELTKVNGLSFFGTTAIPQAVRGLTHRSNSVIRFECVGAKTNLIEAGLERAAKSVNTTVVVSVNDMTQPSTDTPWLDEL